MNISQLRVVNSNSPLLIYLMMLTTVMMMGTGWIGSSLGNLITTQGVKESLPSEYCNANRDPIWYGTAGSMQCNSTVSDAWSLCTCTRVCGWMQRQRLGLMQLELDGWERGIGLDNAATRQRRWVDGLVDGWNFILQRQRFRFHLISI
jgi:hypothetical protein